MAKPNTAQKPALATVPAPAPEEVKRGRKPKPTQWAKWSKSAIRFSTLIRTLEEMAKIKGPAAEVLSAGTVAPETLEDIAELASCLQKLDADRVEVPKIPKAPKPPAFAVGAIVKIAKKFRDKYIETGLYSAKELDQLFVVAVGKGDRVLCQADGVESAAPGGALQVFVRYAKHLEKR